jgi:hypothetical protein
VFDDKKHSPCYSGYSLDIHLGYICDIERSLQNNATSYNFTDYYIECANLYKNKALIQP